MPKFEVGDKVQMTGVPVVVGVLGLGVCEDSAGCEQQTIKFKDPQTGELDEVHASEFVKAAG